LFRLHVTIVFWNEHCSVVFCRKRIKTISQEVQKTKLCPLVGSGILYLDHPKDQPLCLVGWTSRDCTNLSPRWVASQKKGGSFQCTTSSETSLLPTGLQEGTFRRFSHHTETYAVPKKPYAGLERAEKKTNDIEEEGT